MKKHLRGIRSTRDGRQLTCVCGNAEVFYGVSVDEGPLATADRVLAVGSQSCTISVRVCAKRLALSIRPRYSKRLVRQRVWVHN